MPTRADGPSGPAVCCADKVHACAHGYTCGEGGCLNPNGTLPDPKMSPQWPLPMGMQEWQPWWKLCHGPGNKLPVENLPFDVDGTPMTFPYYSTLGALGDGTQPGADKIEIAMIAQASSHSSTSLAPTPPPPPPANPRPTAAE
jgi:hypothetical protein